MSNSPKITIITPSLNQGQYIEETILSVIKQDYSNVELIVIDGGSTDNTIDILRKYNDQIAYWVSEPDNGQANAINKGLRHATGDIFNWINSDDYLQPGALKEIGAYFSIHPEKNVLCGYTRCFYNEDHRTSHVYRMGIQNTVHDTILHVEMNQPGTFYRMSVLKKLQGVNESLRYVFDDELWFRYLCTFGLKDVGFTKKLLAQFRLHKDSKSVGEGFVKFNKELNEILFFMAQYLQFPTYLLNEMRHEDHSLNYVLKHHWNFKFLNKEAFKAFFCAKYLNKIFLTGVSENTTEALKLMVRHRYFKINRMNVSIALKIALKHAGN